jgi:N-acetylglutamate synthase-like GNAT family acetyltransferase
MKNETIEIKQLTDCQEDIPYLAKLWYEEISRHWDKDASVEKAASILVSQANHEKLPMTFAAFINDQPVGMVSLRENDRIEPALGPWLGSLVVDPAYRNRKVGEKLIDTIKQQALLMGYRKLYLLVFGKNIQSWYEHLGWTIMRQDILFEHQVSVMEIALI